jgi:hypothetical protein
MKSIEALIDEGGTITLGAIDPAACAATAAGAHNTRAMLLRKDGETLTALLKRLDRAIGRFYETGEAVDEVNPSD